MPCGTGNASGCGHQVHNAQRHQITQISQQQRNRHAPIQLARRIQGDLPRPIYQTDSPGFHSDGRNIRCLQGGFGQQGRNLGGCGFSLLRPASKFPDIGQLQVRGQALFVQRFGKGRAFLGTGDNDIPVPTGLYNTADLVPA